MSIKEPEDVLGLGLHVTRENSAAVAGLIVRGLRREDAYIAPMTWGDALSEAWIEVSTNRIGQNIGSTITYVRLHIATLARRRRWKFREEIGFVDLLSPKGRAADSLDDLSKSAHGNYSNRLESLTDQELHRELMIAVNDIPGKVGDVAWLHFVEHKSTESIMDELNLSRSSTFCYVSRSRNLIYERMKDVLKH